MRTNLLGPKTRRNAEKLIGRWGAGLPLWFILAGCSPVAGVRSKPPEVRLLVNDRIGVVGQPEFPPRFLPVTRRGKRRDALVVIAPATVKIALRGISGAHVVSMSAEVEGDRISEYRTTVNIAFAIERS